MFKVPEKYRVTKCPAQRMLESNSSAGNNGFFRATIKGIKVSMIVSDGAGYEHVSVTLDTKRTPPWGVMNAVKDLFWSDEDTVIQFHPPKSQYVNCHPYCLHLWRNPEIQDLMIPDKKFIG